MKPRKPRWGWLYAIFVLLVGLLYAETKLMLSGNARVIAQLSVVALVYFLTDLWINENMPFDDWS
jgi:hypothetical protein